MTPTCRHAVLLVEDEPLIRLVTADLLREAGFAVVEASDAEEALTALRDRPEVDILFTDINMPGSMDGVALSRRIHSTHPRVRLILTSGRGAPRRADLPDQGRFVAKPYSVDKVAQLMTAMVAEGRANCAS